MKNIEKQLEYYLNKKNNNYFYSKFINDELIDKKNIS